MGGPTGRAVPDPKARKALAGPAVRPPPCLTHDQDCPFILTNPYDNASDLVGFRLMPLEKAFREPVEAQLEFTVLDMERRLVAYKDRSYGDIRSWRWDFGEGNTAGEQHPIHQYEEAGTTYTVTLYVEGPEGKARMSKFGT